MDLHVLSQTGRAGWLQKMAVYFWEGYINWSMRG